MRVARNVVAVRLGRPWRHPDQLAEHIAVTTVQDDQGEDKDEDDADDDADDDAR